LAIVTTEQESAMVASLIQKAGKRVAFIGGVYLGKKRWEWVDGTGVRFTRWGRGEPNRAGKKLVGRVCKPGIAVDSNNRWDDVRKDGGHDGRVDGYICEWDF